MRLTIGKKIFSITAVILILMIAAAAFSQRMIAEISDDLDRIAAHHMPISESAGNIAVNVLTQGLILQRLFTLEEETEEHLARAATERQRFDRLRIEIEKEFERVIKALERDQLLRRFEQTLKAIRGDYDTFGELAPLLADALAARDRDTFQALLPELNTIQVRTDANIETLYRHLEKSVQELTEKADQNEKLLLRINTILTACAALLGLLFGSLVTRGLVLSVRNLVDGTKAVEMGDLDTQVEPRSKDEVGYLTGNFNHMVGELRLKERIKDTFGKYMDPRIVSNLLDTPEIADPGGGRREMTVMFIDLKGFTSISEVLSPDDLVALINRFFNHMSLAISKYNGVVDKFMGDAVMAYWGPPFTNNVEHASLACQAAIEALRRLEDFHRDVLREIGEQAENLDIDLRIGISSGEMIVGTVGSDVSKNFSVIGDPVNLGARLEGANKDYGTRILVSDSTRQAAMGLVFREVDLLREKGKVLPVRVYEVLGHSVDAPAEMTDLASRFETGLKHYRTREWDRAETAFNAALAHRADDGPAKVFLERIRHFKETPPDVGWDGVWTLESK
ncbi:MAG: adenylate/guanylate cyclase domain-containing protein [Rhodospirillaceae bacterium]